MTTVRPLRRNEIELVVDRCWLPFREEMAQLDEFHALVKDGLREEGIDHRRRMFTADDYRTFVAEADGELVGYLSVGCMNAPAGLARGDAGLILQVFVRPEHRGNGVASDLFDCAEEWATERGFADLVLFVHPDNEPARSVYREWGFEVNREMLIRPLG